MAFKQLSTIAGLFFLIATAGVPATEFIVVDKDFTFESSYNGFHYFRRPQDPFPSTWPKNWLSPVDYYHGGVWEIRIDLKKKASTRPFTLQPCIWMPEKGGGTWFALESCASQPYMRFGSPDVYTSTTDQLDKWWVKDKLIDLSRPQDFNIGLVLRDVGKCYISTWAEPSCADQKAYYVPFDYRLTIVAVAGGSTFSGWNTYFPGSGVGESASGSRGAFQGGDLRISHAGGRTLRVWSTAAQTVRVRVTDISGRTLRGTPEGRVSSFTTGSPGVYFVAVSPSSGAPARRAVLAGD